MLGGIIGGAMAGAGKAAVDYTEKSTLQQEAGDIMRLRDERLSELRKGEAQYADTLKRAPGMAAQGEIDRESAKPAYDEGSDSVRPKTPDEQSSTRRNAYARQGLISEAQKEEELANTRKRDTEHTLTSREQMRSHEDISRQTNEAHERIAQAQLKSHEMIAQLGRDSAEKIAKLHGTVQVDKEGKIQWIGAGGQVVDTGLQSQKDLPPSAKVAADILRDQLKAIDKAETDTIGATPEQLSRFAEQRLRIHGQLIAILAGDVQGAFKPQSPYPDGTELRGKDGKVYVVTGGQPVLKGEGASEATNRVGTKPAPLISEPPGSEPRRTLKERKRGDIEARQADEERQREEEAARRERLRKPEYDDAGH